MMRFKIYELGFMIGSWRAALLIGFQNLNGRLR